MDSFQSLDQNRHQTDQIRNLANINDLKICLENYYRPSRKNLVRLPVISIPEIDCAVVKRLEKLLIGFSQKFQHFNKIGVKVPGGILLHGPVGVGKTRLALSLLKKHDLNVITVKPSQIFSKYLSESEENIVQLFRQASDCAPCVIFLDEIDVYGSKRGILYKSLYHRTGKQRIKCKCENIINTFK